MELLQLLKRIFETELSEDILHSIPVMDFKAGSTLLKTGDTIRIMPLVIEGYVRVFFTDAEGHDILLYYITPLESCAMTFSACLISGKSEVNAVCDEDTKLLAIPVDKMNLWLSKYQSWKEFTMMTVRNRFSELVKTIDSISFKKLDERVWQYLSDRAQLLNSRILTLTHQQIADDLGSSRVAISRLLKALEHEGKLVLYRNQIRLMPDM